MPLSFDVPSVPAPLRESLPAGLRIVQRAGRELIVVDQLQCPRGCALITPTVKIHGENAISLRVRAGETSGLLFVDAFWGAHKKLFDFMFSGSDRDPIVDAFCPHCDAPMSVQGACPAEACRSPRRIEFHLPSGAGLVLACARWGCPEHELVAPGIPRNVLEVVSGINFFGEGEEALFGRM